MNHDAYVVGREAVTLVWDDPQIMHGAHEMAFSDSQGHSQAAALPIAPTPWLVSGRALVIFGHLRRNTARRLAGSPRGFAAPPLLGSFAAVGLIDYSATPVGAYHEVAVIPGILWRDLPGALISHILVDSARSVLAGRALWGLPKVMAAFDWQPHQVLVTDATGQSILSATWQPRKAWPRLALPPLPVMTLRGPRRQFFTASSFATGIQRVHVQLTIPSASPLAALAEITRGPHLALWLDQMRLRLSHAFDLP